MKIQGVEINLTGAKEIAAGGEGKILEHPTDKTKVIKIYHTPRKSEYGKHLINLSTLSKTSFVAPEQIVENGKDVAGFTMSYVNFNDYFLFNNLFNKGYCTANQITSDFKLEVLDQLRKCIEELHAKDIVVGDLNQYNIFVHKRKPEIKFVDVDSFQTVHQPHSGVLLDEIRDWTTTGINKLTDAWSFDILAFWATTYCHPFKWIVKGNSETLQRRVVSQKSILSKIPDLKLPPLYVPPVGDNWKQFDEIFKGRRYFVDLKGSYIPVNVVIKQSLASTNLDIREIATNVFKVYSCGTSITIRDNDRNWQHLETVTKGFTRLLAEHRVDELYPTASALVTRQGNVIDTIRVPNNFTYTFVQAEFYYNNGSLSVLDYGRDLMYNFNLNNQLGGLDHTVTPIFAKSVIYTDTPTQNFGGAKYIIVPVKNGGRLFKVPFGTKNAYYNNEYVATESIDNNNVNYVISNNYKLYFDYLPYFIAKGNLLFIPEDGEIHLYKDGVPIAKFDCPMCTRTSRLYDSNSGILLLENNNLYLLNTK